MDATYVKIYFACELEEYRKVQDAMKGLDAYEAETTFDRYVYFYAMVARADLNEFKRRLSDA